MTLSPIKRAMLTPKGKKGLNALKVPQHSKSLSKSGESVWSLGEARARSFVLGGLARCFSA